MHLTGHAVARVDTTSARGIHLAWAPSRPIGFSIDGYAIWRRRHVQVLEADCHTVGPDALAALHHRLELRTPAALITVRLGRKPELPTELPDEPFRGRMPDEGAPDPGEDPIPTGQARPRAPLDPTTLDEVTLRQWGAVGQGSGAGAALFRSRIAVPGGRVAYTFDFPGGCRGPSIDVGNRRFAAFAFREGKAVASQTTWDTQTVGPVRFERVLADRVVVYVGRALTSLTICCHGKAPNLDDLTGWKNLARGLQLPFAAFEASVSSPAEERALAESRLLAGEVLGDGDFAALSRLMNAAGSQADRAALNTLAIREPSSDGSGALDLSPFFLGMAMTADPMWRRALGFGFVDRDGDLVEDEQYDYLIVGHARARDVSERPLAFHRVPVGTKLPLTFRLDDVFVSTQAPLLVSRPASAGSGESMHRRGVRIAGAIAFSLPEPSDRVILEFDTDEELSLQYQGRSGPWSLGGAVSESGSVPEARRVTLEFAQPIDELRLEGRGFLHGLRRSLLPAGTDPDALVPTWTLVSGVRFADGPPPPAPLFLGTSSVQAPPAPGVPDPTPPSDLGFRLRWLPPPPADGLSPWLWPSDLEGAPPFDMVGFELERARLDTGGDFEPIRDELGDPVRLMGSRFGEWEAPAPLAPGADLLRAYPEQRVPKAPVSIFMEYEDLLASVQRADGPPPGSMHRYRIRSFDVAGRFSAYLEGSPVRLEKRVPPPLPVAAPRPEGGALAPAGVYARVLQVSDPSLSAEERSLLETADNAIVLTWGWTERERTRDPHAREFRVYFEPNPPDRIRGNIVGPAAWNGAEFEVPTILSRPVAADQFTGTRIVSGNRAHRILGHGAGASPVFRLAPYAIDPTAAPIEASFTLAPVHDGSEARPASWAERVEVVPITAERSYRAVLRDRLAVDPEHRRDRAWVGVSASDAEAYVLDERSTGANANRPGNESSIVADAAEIRYRGRPALEEPDPLPPVPERVCPEVSADAVTHRFEVGPLLVNRGVPLPPRYQLERLSVSALLAILSVQGNQGLRVHFPSTPSGPVQPALYAPEAPVDRITLLDQVRAGAPARIENRFVMDLVERLGLDARLTPLWVRVGTQPESSSATSDTLPNAPDRFLYRARAVDAAGHESEASVLLPEVFRVPSSRRPAAPRIESGTLDDEEAEILVVAPDGFDVAGLLWFAELRSVLEPAPPEGTETPKVVRVRNRASAGAGEGIWLRVEGGQLLEPRFVARADAQGADGGLHYAVRVPLPAGQLLRFRCVAVTRDRVPSVPSPVRIVARRAEV